MKHLEKYLEHSKYQKKKKKMPIEEAPHPFLFLGMYILPSIPTIGAIFKDMALREHCVSETFWMVYVINYSQ